MSAHRYNNLFIIGSSDSLLEILKPNFEKIYFSTIVDGNYRLCILDQKTEQEIFRFPLPSSKVTGFLVAHLLYLFSFFKIAKEVGSILFSQVSDYPLIVLFVGRIMNKRLIDFIGGSRFYLSQLLIYSRTHFSRRIAGLYRVIALKLSLKFSRIIVLITDSLINMDPFSEVLNKTHVGLNFPPSKFYNDFKISKEYHKRDNVIGYAGKFTKAKGVHLFAHAVERLSEDNNIKILFIGDYQNSEPPLLGLKIKEIFKGKKNVAFIGQVPHKNMPYYLNEMKLLVLPSFSEGIPHIIIEAMACGTPVAAHPVGGIPLLLRNGQYGYILSSRSPPILGKEISEAFGNTQNCELSEQISSYVRREYNYEKTVEMWKRILGTKRKDEKQWKKES